MSLFSQIKKKINKNKLEISVIGLGYVGLPVAYSFSKKFKVIGFDINTYRVKQLKKNNDINKSISNQDLKNSKIKFSFVEMEVLHQSLITFFVILIKVLSILLIKNFFQE